MVVHRAAPLTEKAERITMVNGYVSLDTRLDEQSRSRDLFPVDDPECLFTEWAKFAAWRSRERLSSLIDAPGFSADREAVAATLEAAIADAQQCVDEMREGDVGMEHYGG